MENIANNLPLFLEPSPSKEKSQRTLLTSIKHTDISEEGRRITNMAYCALSTIVANKVSNATILGDVLYESRLHFFPIIHLSLPSTFSICLCWEWWQFSIAFTYLR